MRRIEKTFQKLKEEGEGALIAYVTSGDPKPEFTPKIVEALINGGVDIVEIGIPFSDPIADGPAIQAATSRALKSGTTPRMSLETAREIGDKHDIPLTILTYYNPIFRMGLENFFKSAKNCRVDGVIVPDLPVEEASEYKQAAETYGVDTIFLAAPSTSLERLRKIIKYSSGFLYLVSLFGVTGVREHVQDLTIQTIKKFTPYAKGRVPLAVGFGVSKPEHVKTIIGSGADGAIVGSIFVNLIARNRWNINKTLKDVEEKARELKKATVKP